MFHEFPAISELFYTFNIDVQNGDEKLVMADERIGRTVVEVFKNFFEKKENVVVYICDTTDKRHFSRKRKFDQWFWKYNDGSILKEDGIAVVEGVEIVNALLMEKTNPRLAEIILAFKDLNERAGEK